MTHLRLGFNLVTIRKRKVRHRRKRPHLDAAYVLRCWQVSGRFAFVTFARLDSATPGLFVVIIASIASLRAASLTLKGFSHAQKNQPDRHDCDSCNDDVVQPHDSNAPIVTQLLWFAHYSLKDGEIRRPS